MRKFIYLFAFVFALASCSTEDADLLLDESVLLDETVPSAKTETEAPMLQVEVQESAAMRATFEELKGGLPTGRSSEAKTSVKPEEDVLCFQFVYPIVLKYSDESQITVTDYDQLLEIILNERSEKYVTGIGFPFEVTMKEDDSLRKITDEDAFSVLIEDCGYDEIDYTYVVNSVSSCFEINYPLDLVINDMVKTFKSQQQAHDYFRNNWSSSNTVSISYPFRATMTESGERISIANDFEMINLIKNTCGIN